MKFFHFATLIFILASCSGTKETDSHTTASPKKDFDTIVEGLRKDPGRVVSCASSSNQPGTLAFHLWQPHTKQVEYWQVGSLNYPYVAQAYDRDGQKIEALDLCEHPDFARDMIVEAYYSSFDGPVLVALKATGKKEE